MVQMLDLAFNPFEPSAAGPPLGSDIVAPDTVVNKIDYVLDLYEHGHGVKPIVVVGEYGTGKTCLLQWLHRERLPRHRIKSFYFDNPGVQFYDLANALLRTIGRKDFAKFLWELAGPHVSAPYQQDLFRRGFEAYLSTTTPRQRVDIAVPLQEAIIAVGVTTDEEIAHCLARIVTDAVKKPYFEYRDFIPRQRGSLVAEAEEAPYLTAILRTISRGTGANGIAFLIDEFEEIGLQKRLSRRAAHDYLATMKRLINLAQTENSDFWLVLSMTHDAYDTTSNLEPALHQRFSEGGLLVEVSPLEAEDALLLMRTRLQAARVEGASDRFDTLFPFPEDICFRLSTYSNPRRLVKACSFALSGASASTSLPFSSEYLHSIEDKLFPLPAKQSQT